MDKTNVVKSKSSNSAITPKSDNHSNKSRSNAEFQRHVVKKRGVYVEKKATNLSIYNAANPRNKSASPTPVAAAVATPKAPPRPKPGQKRFLASVLTILSKSTAATQFPEDGTKKTKRKTDSRQKKYRSKVLNDEMIKNLDQQKPLVLQYKNINKTSSNYSDTDSYKTRDIYSTKSNLLKSDIVSVMSSEAKGIVKEVLEGLQSKKDARIHDPVTQVEKITKRKQKGENDEQLYKFFVDLLETTFSVYNVNARYDAAPNIESGFSSKVNFEIDESVVNKLENRNYHDDDSHKPQSYYVNDNNVLGGNSEIPDLRNSKEVRPKEPKDVLPRPERPKRMKTQSFIYNAKPKKFDPDQFQPLRFPKKTVSRKTKKKTLINLFKEQLKMSYSDYEEPQTLYEALRVMARNKRKYQKAIRFDAPRAPPSQECVFKRPKIISPKKTKKKLLKYNYVYPNDDMMTSKSFNRNPAERESYETLEVYGYDYEVNNQGINADKDTILSTFPSDDDFGFDTFNNSMTVNDQIEMYGPVTR